MRAALNQFSYDVMKIRVGEAKGSNVNFNNNNDDLLFLCFYNCGYFEGGPRQMSPIPSSGIRHCWGIQIPFCS